jgi:hypothetical protein
MLTLEGLRGESLVLDGEWVEKLNTGGSAARQPVSTYRESQISDIGRRKFILFGEKKTWLHLVVACNTFLSLQVPAERRAEVDAFVAALERAKAAAG